MGQEVGWRRLRRNGASGVDVTLAFSAFLIRRQRAAGLRRRSLRGSRQSGETATKGAALLSLATEKRSSLKAFAAWSGSPRLTSADSEVTRSLFCFCNYAEVTPQEFTLWIVRTFIPSTGHAAEDANCSLLAAGRHPFISAGCCSNH